VLLLPVLAGCIKKPEDNNEGVVLAQLAVDLDANESYIRTAESPVGNLVADAVLNGLKSYGIEVDFALINAGSIRFDSENRATGIYPKGNFTSEMLNELLPFSENKLVIVQVTGLQMREMVERSLALLPLDKGSFLQVSKGLKIQADLSLQPQVLDETVNPVIIQTPGQRVISISFNETPIGDVQIYRVALADYISDGNDGYVTCRNLASDLKFNTNFSQTNLVREQVIIQSVIEPKTEGRIQF
jgi:5'-nucleotidase / UDP-sugar diphosphatase